MDMWRNPVTMNGGDVVCHNRCRAVSLGEEDISSKLTSSIINNSNGSLNNSFDSSSNNGGNNPDNTFSLKSYIVNIAANEPVHMKRELNKNDISERKGMDISWKERMNDYSFMKR